MLNNAIEHSTSIRIGIEVSIQKKMLSFIVNVKKTKKLKRGTQVIFEIHTSSERHLNEQFKQHTNLTKDSDYGFDKTKIHVKLYTIGNVHISRSQARRVLSGLENSRLLYLILTRFR